MPAGLGRRGVARSCAIGVIAWLGMLSWGCSTSYRSEAWDESPFQQVVATEPPVQGEAQFQVLVVGGGTGGTAAALAAAESGATVCVTEETSWLGGQYTAQGLGCSDESGLSVEESTVSNQFRQFRALTRAHYRGIGNPGGSWLSGLSAEPRAFLSAIAKMTRPYVDSGRMHIYLGVRPTQVLKEGNRVTGVSFTRVADGSTFVVKADQVIDATELGDAIKLAGAAYRIGQESRADTGEVDAPVTGNPASIQAFTYCIVLERRPEGEVHTIPKPVGYGVDPWMQEFTLARFPVFDGKTSFFGWRKIRSSELVGGKELALINWAGGNDYWHGNIVDVPQDQMDLHLERGKLRALAFIYWLQTEADGKGYPNLKIDTASLGTASGIAMTPYIRECRRIRALETIKAEDVSNYYQAGARALNMQNSLGIGDYAFDPHRMTAPGSVRAKGISLPFQIPLGALVPEATDSLLAGAKNLGTTHLTSAAYRTHPIEWAVGEAAGRLAAFCAGRGVQPREVFGSEPLTRQLQERVLSAGVPLYWIRDVPGWDSDWKEIQLAATTGAVPGALAELDFQPDAGFTRAEGAVALTKALHLDEYVPETPSCLDVPVTHPAFRAIETCLRNGYFREAVGGHFQPDNALRTGYLDQQIFQATGGRQFASLPEDTAVTRRLAARGFVAVLRHRVKPAA